MAHDDWLQVLAYQRRLQDDYVQLSQRNHDTLARLAEAEAHSRQPPVHRRSLGRLDQ